MRYLLWKAFCPKCSWLIMICSSEVICLSSNQKIESWLSHLRLRFDAHTTLPFPFDAQSAQPWRRRAGVRERSSCEGDLGEYKRCSHSQSAQTHRWPPPPTSPTPPPISFSSLLSHRDSLLPHIFQKLFHSCSTSYFWSARQDISLAKIVWVSFFFFFQHRGQSGQRRRMEPYTVPGAQLSLSDLYSVIPFNVTFPDEESGLMGDRLQNYTEQQQGPVRSAGGIIIAISITALYSVICVVGLLGNVLVMYGVVR